MTLSQRRPPVLDLECDDLELPGHGNPPRDIRKAAEKIRAKFPQIGSEQAIIAIWNDEEELEELEVEAAVRFWPPTGTRRPSGSQCGHGVWITAPGLRRLDHEGAKGTKSRSTKHEARAQSGMLRTTARAAWCGMVPSRLRASRFRLLRAFVIQTPWSNPRQRAYL